MRLSELNEAEQNKRAVFTFGRLNPPHYGHHAMINTLIKEAQRTGGDWFLFVSSKTGDEKNPLTYEQKCWWIKALFPETEGHLVEDANIKNPLQAAQWLWNKGYRSATFVAGEDDMPSYSKMMQGGVDFGKKNPDAVANNKAFLFNPLDFAVSPRLASATNARKNVQDNDPEAFVRSILGPKISPKLEKLVHDQLFPTVRKAMGLTEYETVSEATEESAQLDKHTPNVKELAKRYTTSDSAVQRQLAKGIKTEFEHTSNIDVAREIALDHLGERLDYYDKLAKIEKEDVDESWSKKYKKSINCSNPKGFSQKAHCAGRRARQSGKKTKSKSVSENFADGKGPGKPGDSQRHGIPKGATIAQLEKAAKAPGRKGQLARWQLNMRRGKKRAQENGPIAFGGGPGGNADSGPLIDRQVAPFPWDIYTPHPKEIDEVKVPAAEIVKYVRKIHPEGEWNIDYTITDHPFWTLKTVPINRLHIFDPDQEEIEDPYNRVQDTNLDHVRRLMPNIANNLKQNPIVVDHRGYVLDGNHRALAAAKAGLTSIPVWMPAKEGVDETLKKVKGKWALVSRHDPKKVLQYYHGSGHPSKEWVSKVERRIHSFSEDVEETIKPRVYIDMDGVIADFFGEWTRLSGVDHYKDIEDVEAKLQLVREHPTFWVDLPVLPHAKALIKTVIDHFGEYRICSKPLEGDARSKPGKMEWIRKHLSDMPPAEVILTADKAAYAKHAGIPSVLIDDFGKNVMSWRAAGGIAIKYEDEHFREVAAILERIARSGVSK